MKIERKTFQPYAPKDRTDYEAIRITTAAGNVVEMHDSPKGESLTIHTIRQSKRHGVVYYDHSDGQGPCGGHAFADEAGA